MKGPFINQKMPREETSTLRGFKYPRFERILNSGVFGVFSPFNWSKKIKKLNTGRVRSTFFKRFGNVGQLQATGLWISKVKKVVTCGMTPTNQ